MEIPHLFSNHKYFHSLFIVLILPIFTVSFAGCNKRGSHIDCSNKNYWVAVNGNNSADGSVDTPFLTLDRARDAVRLDPARTSCAITVNIKAGTYRLDAPFVLDAQDSGSSYGSVTYQAAAGEQVLISGAKQITGWTLDNVGLNIWKAQTDVTSETMPRQLYVNEVRAVRARTVDYPNYYTPTTNGYDYLYIIGTDPQIPPTWENPTAIEAVTATQWKMMRCPIAQINTGSEVIMQQPCWNNANVYPSPWNFHLLSWWENAYEFLDEANEWYLNPVTKVLYYIPPAGVDPNTLDIELPVLETLVQGNGTLEQPVSYINFKGLNFSYATWLGPNTSDGYVTDQSGFHLTGSNHTSNVTGHDPDAVRTPGNLSFIYSQNISFLNNNFSHMGAVALDFGTGSQNNQIAHNTFNDISAAAIQLGGIALEDHHPSYSQQFTKDNEITYNLIQYTGQDYYDAPGIYIGFTTRSLVAHNVIQHTSWSGIAIGWGWGLLDPGGFPGLPHATPSQWGTYTTPTAAHQNQILSNKIQCFLEKLWDGGAIYSTGFQGTSLEDGQIISGNVASDKRAAAGGNTFYTDGGSRFVTLKNNVSLNNPAGYFDFGPCGKASSFDVLCLTTNIVSYGADMGGCVPYGDLFFDTNYLRDRFTFFNVYDLCTNLYFPNSPVRMSFIHNEQITDSSEVPTAILSDAGGAP